MINMMFDVPLFLSHSGLYVALATIFLLFLVLYNPRLMLQDYPPRSWQLSRPKRMQNSANPHGWDCRLYWCCSFSQSMPPSLFKRGLAAKWASCRYGPMLSGSPFFQPVGLAGSGLVDLLHHHAQQFVIPGSEGHPAYKDYFFHFRGFLIGTVFSA